MIDILVLFHSVSEHAWRLAEAVAEGARVPSVNAKVMDLFLVWARRPDS